MLRSTFLTLMARCAFKATTVSAGMIPPVIFAIANVFTVSLLVHIRQGVCILLDYGNETHFFAGSALSSFGRPDPPATSQSDGRAGSMCLLFHGSNRRASAQDFPASCLLEEGGHRRGQARGQVDALQARRSIQPACRFNSEECARGPEARYGATARPTAPQPRLLRSQESGSVAWSAGAIFARVRGSSGVGNGNRTRNRRSHSPVLCQLSYSHRHADYTTAIPCCQNRKPSPSRDGASLPRLGRTIQSSAKNRHHMELSIGTSREKGQQNKVREKPSRTFERKKQARAYDVTRSCCAPGSKTAVGLTRAPHPRIQIPWRASAPSPEDSWC